MSGPENKLSRGVSMTPSSVKTERPKASLNKEGFDTLINQKGYPIFIDKSIKCPCSIEINGQPLVGCRNCGGSGWVFYNRIETEGIIHSMNRDTKFKEWSEQMLGTASLTTYHEIKLSYMDKVTLRQGEVSYNELLSLKEFDDNEWRTCLKYSPLSIECASLFEGKGVKLKILKIGVDYVIESSQVLRLLDPQLIQGITNPQLSIRYSHRPQFLIIDLPRITISSLSRDPQIKVENYLNYPIHAVMRVPHYILNQDSNDGTYLLDNSFEQVSCGKKKIYINGNSIVVDIYDQEHIDTIVPFKGLIIFNDTDSVFQGWNGESWVVFSQGVLE